MRTFVNYVKFKLNEDAPAPPPPAGAPPAGAPPMGGPPRGGGGPPPMGGGPPMGGPPPMGGGAGGAGGATPPATKIKSSNVWDALKKLFNPKESKK